jgi:predicted NAD-dependent protein-ADP-ribosyltransferase YbiA (DUF1768 family)
MKNEISFTKVKLPFGWLGNMSAYPIEYLGKTWKTNEALFQALRFEDGEIREAIRNEPSPMGAKLKVKEIVKYLIKNNELHKRIVEPLSDKDVENMELCIRLKIEQHPDLRQELLATAGKKIYEDVTSRGRKETNLFWGAIKHEDDSWEGKNTLGEIWMKTRDEIIDEYKQFSLADKAAKFGLYEDPYKELKEAYDLGYDIAELCTEDMKWYIPLKITWDKPSKCYKIIR